MAERAVIADNGALVGAVKGFDEGAKNVRAAMNALDNALKADVTKYKGEQAKAFWDLHVLIQGDLEKAGTQLDVMSRAVHKSLKEYTGADVNQASNVNKIKGRTGSPVLSRLSGQ